MIDDRIPTFEELSDTEKLLVLRHQIAHNRKMLAVMCKEYTVKYAQDQDAFMRDIDLAELEPKIRSCAGGCTDLQDLYDGISRFKPGQSELAN